MSDHARQPDATTPPSAELFGPIQPIAPYPPRYWWLKRIGVVCMLLMVGLVVLRLWWGAYAERKLQAKLDELRAAGAPVTIDDLNRPPIPDEENAAKYLQDAAAMLKIPDGVTLEFGDGVRDIYSDPARLEELRLLVESNAGVVPLVRKADDCSGADWGIVRTSPVLFTTFADLPNQRTLARNLSDQTAYEHLVGRDDRAVSRVSGMFEVGRGVRQMRAGVIGYLVELAIQSTTITVLHRIHSGLLVGDHDEGSVSPSAVRALIDRLLDDQPLHDHWRQAIALERFGRMEHMLLVADGSLNPGELTGAEPWPRVWPESFRALFSPMIKMDALFVARQLSILLEAGVAPDYPTAARILARTERWSTQPGIQQT